MSLRLVNQHNQQEYSRQSGNVLFLILVAVALFAALSYAVTQSTRSGGGDVSPEKMRLEIASAQQHTVALRTAVLRMQMSGTDIADLEFNKPDNLSSLTSPLVGVFHPLGGGVAYHTPSELIADVGIPIVWVFNMDFNVQDAGTSANDLVAFLIGLSPKACEEINKKLGLSGVPLVYNDWYGSKLANFSDRYMDNNYVPALNYTINVFSTSGVQEGCYEATDDSDRFVYYSVLLAL